MRPKQIAGEKTRISWTWSPGVLSGVEPKIQPWGSITTPMIPVLFCILGLLEQFFWGPAMY